MEPVEPIFFYFCNQTFAHFQKLGVGPLLPDFVQKYTYFGGNFGPIMNF